jgi:hypothetical integral membrane protein (TIGR02206 family)
MESLYIENNSFTPFNFEHYIWLAYGVLSTIFWIWLGRRATSDAEKRKIALYMCLVGVVAWIWCNVVMFGTGQGKAGTALPFHLCYFLNFLFPILYWTHRTHWLDWLYPIVMAGCLQAFITPDLTQSFPHYISVRYWLVHTALIQSMLYAILVYGFRPTAKGILKCFLFMNAYALFVTPINLVFDTNFLYVREPAKGSAMELMGPWPQYLIVIEGLMLVLFTVVYLPFWITGFWKKKSKIKTK